MSGRANTGKQEPQRLCSAEKLKSMDAWERGHHQKYMSKSVCQIDHRLTRLRLCLIDSPFSWVSGESSQAYFPGKYFILDPIAQILDEDYPSLSAY